MAAWYEFLITCFGLTNILPEMPIDSKLLPMLHMLSFVYLPVAIKK